MHKAKNIYFLLIKKKTRWPKAGCGPRPFPIITLFTKYIPESKFKFSEHSPFTVNRSAIFRCLSQSYTLEKKVY